MAHAFKLQESTSFHSYVRSCVWDEYSYQWEIIVDCSTEEGRQTQFWIADIIIHCVGQLNRPKFGTTPGLENFNGKYWHTNLWPKLKSGDGDVDENELIKGKNVAVIGCGSSAAQVIPAIVDDVEHLAVFMGTPLVVLPRMDMPLSTIFKWACRWIPLFAWIWRWKMTLEFGKRAMMGAVDNSAANDRVNFVANKFMEKQVKDPGLRKLLRPNAKCKLFLLLHFQRSLILG
jgi:cation diffusion facilitator CzcD-associated flavoprotein CzcO